MGVTIRVLIADDIRPFVNGLKGMLAELPAVDLIGEAFTSTEAVTKAISLRPDVIMIDLHWKEERTGGLSMRQHYERGLEAIRRIKQQAPEVAVLAMTAHAELVEQARRHGADVAVMKEQLNDFDQLELLLHHAIETVRSPQIRRDEFEQLSVREQQILELMAKGLTDQEISTRLAWGIGVIKRDVQAIFEKLRVRSRAHAVARGYDLGLLQKDSSFDSNES
ncbi:response regulator transcription factor [Chloroflexus sp.]|uniref:response regulator transcription factor n=1 Tax=Chloroflexus sp. TaxID=1904827 RepID=UPI00404A16C9